MIDNPSQSNNLAFCYENPFTAVVRLGSLSQAELPTSTAFRNNIRAALKAAMEQAKSLGYQNDMIQSSVSAVVAFLDESVLKLQSPVFADWSQRTVQEELFGHNRMGEVFFENLRGLLARQDSRETADCLEVYCLCLLLGFRGRFALSSGDTDFLTSRSGAGPGSAPRPSGDIQALVHQAREKIDRIRGRAIFLRAADAPPEIRQMATIDRWSRGLGIAALCLLILAFLAYGGLWILLNSGLSKLS